MHGWLQLTVIIISFLIYGVGKVMMERQLCNYEPKNGSVFALEDECNHLNNNNNNNNNNNSNNNYNNISINNNNDGIEKIDALLPLSERNAAYEFPKKVRINLEFCDIRYTVKKWSSNSIHPEVKEILKGVSGEFLATKLTAIMGPSGAGKSTLLNILAAYKLRGASGSVRINSKERSSKNPDEFKKLSCYIQQDDYLRMELLVHEAMIYAADLKLGSSVSKKKKKEQVKKLLKMLGLFHCWDTPTAGLSGGQKKRLSIALELIGNPPIIFLDEPTTGLDSSSCSQCVSLLKVLAQQGRTVICTIHQPSALIFEMFDNLYALSAGECIYSGAVRNLIGYLREINLTCPKYHNPADFLLDVAVGDCGADFNTLVATAKSSVHKAKDSYMNTEGGEEIIGGVDPKDEQKSDAFSDANEFPPISQIKPASFLKQFCLLYSRNLLMIKRKPGNVLVRAIAHLAIALLFGYLYRDVGTKATTVLANYCYIYGSNLFVVYTGKMSVALLFPLELCIVSREHFNGWYALGPYYLSMMLVEVPFQIICCWLYLPLSYYLTGQPLEWNRFLYFTIIASASSLAAQASGFLLGITLPKKIAVFLGPVLACLLSVFGFCLRFVDTPKFFRWLYYISYYRASFQSSVYSIYGLNRTTLACEDFYCHFKNPKKFLLEMDMPEVYLEFNFILILTWVVALHIMTVIIIWYKLNRK